MTQLPGNHIVRHERGDDLRPCHYRPLPLVHLHESGDPLLSGADTADNKGEVGGLWGLTNIHRRNTVPIANRNCGNPDGSQDSRGDDDRPGPTPRDTSVLRTWLLALLPPSGERACHSP